MELLLILFSALSALSLPAAGNKLNFQLSTDPNDVKFFLFPNKTNTDDMEEIIYDNVTSLISSRMEADIPTLIIVHGFCSGMDSENSQMLKNAFLDSDLRINIILVDWLPLSYPKPPEYAYNFYDKVVQNVPIVGGRIGDFISFLVGQSKTSLEKVHIVGHSLGAHVSGVAGKVVFKNTGNKLARITGLDPAFPKFWPSNPEKNLMKEDAHFVDVIHTNMGEQGSVTQEGHADFYPNGGSHQPGCEEGDRLPNPPGQCSHHFSYKFFASSIKEDFKSCPCTFTLPKREIEMQCSAKCDNPIQMGYHCPITASGMYYLSTSNSPLDVNSIDSINS